MFHYLQVRLQPLTRNMPFPCKKVIKIGFFSLLLLCLVSVGSNAQGLQPGECGIRFTYDGTGALIKRDYLCNNTGVILYFMPFDSTITPISNKVYVDVVKLNSISPNPTSGKFSVSLANPLVNNDVIFLTANGIIIHRTKFTGSTMQFDLSPQPAGVYFLKIEYKDRVLTLRVVKQ